MMKEPAINTEDQSATDLTALRAEKNISLETVAEKIKVSQDFIKYIESGQFEKLGAPTFLRGHITNYCKTLGINPKLVLSQVPQELLQHQRLQTSDAVGASPLARVRRQSNHLGRYVFGTALLAMLGLSFYFVWDKWSTSNTDQRLSELSRLQANETQVGNDGDKKITYSSLLPQVNTVAQPDTAAPDETVDPATEAVDTLPVATEPEEGAEPVDDTDPFQTVHAETTAAPITADTAAKSAAFLIKMDLEEEAWVSIKTLDGDKVVHDLIGPGLREYRSDQPMHFRIGNAKKMRLSINDDEVDLNQLTKKDVADFEWPLNPNS